MTIQEHNKLLQNDFNMLWNDLWGEHIGIQYRGEERVSKEKYENLINGINDVSGTYNLKSLIDEVETKWVGLGQFPPGSHPPVDIAAALIDLGWVLVEFQQESTAETHTFGQAPGRAFSSTRRATFEVTEGTCNAYDEICGATIQ